MLYMILYIFINFPSNWVLDEKGIRKGIMIGAITTALGSGIRCLVNVSFSFAIVGQLFCSIGQPFILNAPTKIASRWFNKKNVRIIINIETFSVSLFSSCKYCRNSYRFCSSFLFCTINQFEK